MTLAAAASTALSRLEASVNSVGDTPVYRFFDATDGSHLFAANLNDYASVLATRTDLINEGLAFYTAKPSLSSFPARSRSAGRC